MPKVVPFVSPAFVLVLDPRHPSSPFNDIASCFNEVPLERYASLVGKHAYFYVDGVDRGYQRKALVRARITMVNESVFPPTRYSFMTDLVPVVRWPPVLQLVDRSGLERCIERYGRDVVCR